MALKDWVRHDGYINSTPSITTYNTDEEFIMLVRDIQFNDIKTGNFNKFKTLYDIGTANVGRNYIPVTDNNSLIQEPPNPNLLKKY